MQIRHARLIMHAASMELLELCWQFSNMPLTTWTARKQVCEMQGLLI